jgi:hypothetical protein
VAAPVYLD